MDKLINSAVEENKLYKTSEVASMLDVKMHIIYQYSEKFKLFLSDNVKLHKNGKYKLYNDKAVQILKVIIGLARKGEKTKAIIEELSGTTDTLLLDKQLLFNNRVDLEILHLIKDRVFSIDEEIKETTIRLSNILKILKDFHEKPNAHIDKKIWSGGIFKKMLSIFARN